MSGAAREVQGRESERGRTLVADRLHKVLDERAGKAAERLEAERSVLLTRKEVVDHERGQDSSLVVRFAPVALERRRRDAPR